MGGFIQLDFSSITQMNTILDYIEWRGDLSFASNQLNEVDSLIFCQLSYIDFSSIISESFDKAITLKEAALILKIQQILSKEKSKRNNGS